MVQTRSSIAIAKRFADVLDSIQPLSRDVDKAQKHFDTIHSRIQKRYDIVKSLWVGSHSKGTAIRNVSDIDVFVVIRRDELKRGDGYIQPLTLLNWFRSDLRDCFPQTWVGREGMATVVNFGQGQYKVDVVPAMYLRQHPSGMPLYDIPDPANDWLTTSPDAHGRFFRTQNERAGHRLQRIVQLLKHWIHSRTPPLPLHSFHTEMVLAKEDVGAFPGSYSRHVAHALSVLASRGGAALRDPLQISGLIPAVKTAAQREKLGRALDYAATHATAAVEAEDMGDTQEAIRQWRIVFNDAYPSR